MRCATHDLFDSIDSFCARNPDDPMAFGWIPPDERPDPLGTVSFIDFDAPPPVAPGTPRTVGAMPSGRPTPLSMNDAVPRLMDTLQAAAYLGTSVRFVRRCANDGRLVITKVGRHNRYTADDLDKLTSRRVGGDRRATAPKRRTAQEATPPATYDPIAEAVARARVSPPAGK
jgi:excisionase family DNA binding protein